MQCLSSNFAIHTYLSATLLSYPSHGSVLKGNRNRVKLTLPYSHSFPMLSLYPCPLSHKAFYSAVSPLSSFNPHIGFCVLDFRYVCTDQSGHLFQLFHLAEYMTRYTMKMYLISCAVVTHHNL